MAVPVFNEIGVCGVTLRGASKTNDVNNINIIYVIEDDTLVKIKTTYTRNYRQKQPNVQGNLMYMAKRYLVTIHQYLAMLSLSVTIRVIYLDGFFFIVVFIIFFFEFRKKKIALYYFKKTKL